MILFIPIIRIISLAFLSMLHISAPAAKTELSSQPDHYLQKVAKGKAQYRKVRRGDNMQTLLQSIGMSIGQINMISRFGVLDRQRALSKGEQYRVVTGGENGLSEIRFFDLARDIAFVYWKDKSQAGAFETLSGLRVGKRTVSGRVNGSLLASIQSRISDEWVGLRFMDAFALDFKVSRLLKRGADFMFVIETKYDGERLVGYGEILEAHLEVNGRMESRYFVPFAGGGGSFIDHGDPYTQRPLFAPVNYLRISSQFQASRYHPIKRRRIAHMGIDFELPQGDDVLASASGTVVRTGRNRASGNFVVIRHSSGMETYYNHLQSIASGMDAGRSVSAAQRIGAVGCTGYCTRAHLHFAVKINGRFVDPAKLVRSYPYSQRNRINQSIAARDN